MVQGRAEEKGIEGRGGKRGGNVRGSMEGDEGGEIRGGQGEGSVEPS